MYVAHRCTSATTHTPYIPTHTHTHTHYSLTHSICNSATIFAGNKLVPPFLFPLLLSIASLSHVPFRLLPPLSPPPLPPSPPHPMGITAAAAQKYHLLFTVVKVYQRVCAFTFCAHCVCAYCFCSSCVSFSHCGFLMIALGCIVVLSPIRDCMLRRRFVYFVFRFLAA